MVFNIVASCDNNFAQHTCVMLTSLLSHHPNQSFRIFLLVPESFSEENRQKMANSLKPWMTEPEFVVVSERKLSGLKVDGHISAAAYYRLWVELLPQSIKFALYLDSDIIINDSILDLLHMDISTYVLAAVPDVWADRDEIVRAKICLKETAHYLNSGVLLLNLERWRFDKIGSRALEFCISNPESITYWDQCALNHIIQGRFYILDQKWNFQVWNMSSTELHPCARLRASSAAIIHFTTRLKPWNYMFTHPMKELYFRYLKYTEWRDFIETGRTPRNIVKRYLRVNFPSTSLRVEAAYMAGKRVLVSVRRSEARSIAPPRCSARPSRDDS